MVPIQPGHWAAILLQVQQLFKLQLGDKNNRLERPFTQPMGLYTANGLGVFEYNTKMIGIVDGVTNET